MHVHMLSCGVCDCATIILFIIAAKETGVEEGSYPNGTNTEYVSEVSHVYIHRNV